VLKSISQVRKEGNCCAATYYHKTRTKWAKTETKTRPRNWSHNMLECEQLRRASAAERWQLAARMQKEFLHYVTSPSLRRRYQVRRDMPSATHGCIAVMVRCASPAILRPPYSLSRGLGSGIGSGLRRDRRRASSRSCCRLIWSYKPMPMVPLTLAQFPGICRFDPVYWHNLAQS
jgi:hypothetical protein